MKRLKVIDRFKSSRDFLWVLQAFLRGKVLRQKAYRPHGNGKGFFLRVPEGTSQERSTALLKKWKGKPIMVKDVVEGSNSSSIFSLIYDKELNRWIAHNQS